jgi:hypothetical protein
LAASLVAGIITGKWSATLRFDLPTFWTNKKKGPPSVGNYKWFSDAEVVGLDKELCAKLDMAREKAGVPFVITSGLRTPAQNACIHGAVADSAHLSGLAVDLATGDDHMKNRVMFGLTVAGLADRVGEYFKIDPTNPDRLVSHHVHIDIMFDAQHPREYTWALKEAN